VEPLTAGAQFTGFTSTNVHNLTQALNLHFFLLSLVEPLTAEACPVSVPADYSDPRAYEQRAENVQQYEFYGLAAPQGTDVRLGVNNGGRSSLPLSPPSRCALALLYYYLLYSCFTTGALYDSRPPAGALDVLALLVQKYKY
jgi:hypothetical protein